MFLAKVLLPEVFESLSLQDMRMLITEGSMLKIYMNHEHVEIQQYSIGFLLEGFIKAHSSVEELIISPAVLLPARGNGSGQ